MERPRPFHLDRRGRRLWITLPEEDWQMLEEQAARRYASVAGLISILSDEWCESIRAKAIGLRMSEDVKADLVAREGNR